MWINSELSVSDEITQKIKIATVTKMPESGNHEVRPWFLLITTSQQMSIFESVVKWTVERMKMGVHPKVDGLQSANVYFRVNYEMNGRNC